jgi:hypothetical protein
MLRQNLPDLKTDKGEHYADILTSLYKQQMRLIREEEKVYEQRARELAVARKEMPIEANGEAEKGGEGANRSNGPAETKDDQALQTDGFVSARQGGIASQCESLQEHDLQPTVGSELDPVSGPSAGARTAPQATVGKGSKGDQAESQAESWNERAGNGGQSPIDKTKLPISTPRRIRDKEHLRYVASQPCIVCGRAPSHAHHLRFAQPRALGRKVSDEWTVPLCVTHHHALHTVGSEKQWWEEKGIDPIAHAVRLWWDTRHGGKVRRMGALLMDQP